MNSSVLRWPDREEVERAVRHWAEAASQARSDIIAIGYFGSYAQGDWGVGSDLDLIVLLEASDLPFERRAAEWDTTGLPVPADLLVYTSQEFDDLRNAGGRFGKMLREETVWLKTAGGFPQNGHESL